MKVRDSSIFNEYITIKDGKVLMFSDTHIPFQDDEAIEELKNVIKNNKFTAIILAGDIVDMFKVSKFSKGLGRSAHEEVQLLKEFLTDIKNIAGNANVFYCIGNHETRIHKYILANAPEVDGFIPPYFDLIDAKGLGIIGCAGVVINNDFFVYHGRVVKKHAGESAVAELNRNYISGASGHVHRLAKTQTRRGFRKLVWLELGCLCDLNPDYIENPDWQQGFGVLEYQNGKLKTAEVYQISDGKILKGELDV